jgi:hypothetical protein
MTFASKLLPTSPSDRRITLCVMFIIVVNFMIGWLRAIVLFSDVRVNVVFDFIEMFSLTLIGLSFCLHSKLKVKLIALCCTVGLYLITSIVCSGKIHAKIWRFQNPDRYSLALLNEVTVKNKTIKLYLVRDQKFDCLMLTRVEQICKGIERYWPIEMFWHTYEGKLHLNQDSMIVTDGKGQTQVIPLSAIP